MKPILAMFVAMFVLFTALTVFSQTVPGTDTMQSEIRRGLLQGRDRNLLTVQPGKPNEIRHGRISYDGILVQLVKTENPLQLINPAAPAEYGSSRDNVVENPSMGLEHGAREGLNLFSIRF